ncbi:MAG: thioesterase family protein [Sulfurovaceae bacterium]|nr:thioesterase family protein [Sulfurovaceae bacterium]
MTIRVYYEDTDSNGVVYHANYIKFCDRVRQEAFFKKNIAIQDENGNLIIRKLEARYLHPSYLGDELIVTLHVKNLSKVSIDIYHEIFRKKDMQKVFVMDIQLVYVNLENKIDKMPDSFLQLISVHQS